MKKQNIVSLSFISLLAILCMAIVFLFPTPVMASSIMETQNYSYSLSGSGEEDNPYKISSKQDLIGFASNVNTGITYDDKYVVLTQDITLSSTESFVPIGYNSAHTFQGNFNGQGHIISNLTFTDSGYTYVGLFGYVCAKYDVRISNVVLENVRFNIQKTGTQIFAGSLLGFCEISHSELSETYFQNTCQISKVVVKNSRYNIALSAVNPSSEYHLIIASDLVGTTNVQQGAYLFNDSYFATETLIISQSYVVHSTLASGVMTDAHTHTFHCAGILGYGVGAISNCYSINTFLLDGWPTNRASDGGVLSIKFSYALVNEEYKYRYYGENLNQQAEPYHEHKTNNINDVYEALTRTHNDLKNFWIINDDNELIIKNVGNSYVETSGTISVIEREYNLANSSVSLQYTTTTSEKTLTLNQTFTAPTHTNCNQTSLRNLNLPYMTFTKGSSTIPLNTPSFTVTQDYVNYALDGYTLIINYIDGSPITINGKAYWLVNGDNNLYYFDTDKFIKVTLSDSSMFPSQTGKYFLGWSLTNVNDTCELTNKVVNDTYIDWNTTGITFAIKVNYGNMQSSGGTDTTMTGFTLNTTYESLADKTLYAVWGDFKFKLFTKVYIFDGTNYKESNGVKMSISPTVTPATDGFKIEKNIEYSLTLRNTKNIEIQAGADKGYLSVQWLVGSLVNNVPTALTGSQYGTLSATDTVSTTLTGATVETSLIAILTPKTNIQIVVNTNDFENKDTTYIKINDETLTSATTLVYGETYTITIQDLAYGYFISSATSSPNTSLTKNINTCTFTVDFANDSITVNLNVEESILSNVISYGFIALLIIAGATIVLTLIINCFKPAEIKNKE